MATLSFTGADIALYADVENTLVVLPRLTTSTWNRSYSGVAVSFDGDEWPTPIFGEGKHQQYEMSVTFGSDEHTDAQALLDLFDLASESPDPRLQFRADTSDVAGFALHMVGTVFAVNGTLIPGKAFTLSFSFVRTTDGF